MTGIPVLLVGVALLAAAVEPAVAHTGGSTGYATIAIDSARVRYQLTLWPAALPPSVGAEIERARAGDATGRDRLAGIVREKVAIRADGRRCEAGPGSFPAVATAGASVTVVVEFTCGSNGRDMVIREIVIRDDIFDALGADHHTLARIDTGARSQQFAFASEAREARVNLREGALGIGSFVRLGIEHILTGWDHLLFLLVLLLRGGGWLSLAKIVTAFTLAHSVTLTLAALDVVTLPERLVEAVIALSIAAVAAENLSRRPLVSRRWLVSFCFGLVHGFGFSSALRELGLPRQGLLASLLGFNAGVEIGQALVVAVALPALVLLRSTRWELRVVWTSSLAVLLVGVVLFVERALL